MLRMVLVGLALGTAVLAADPSSSVTFTRDVLPILQKNCQTCHRPGQVAPMSLLTYKDARPWAKAIKAAVTTRTMPPWFADPKYGHFANDRSLSQPEIDALVHWVDGGTPEGDPQDPPPARVAARLDDRYSGRSLPNAEGLSDPGQRGDRLSVHHSSDALFRGQVDSEGSGPAQRHPSCPSCCGLHP